MVQGATFFPYFASKILKSKQIIMIKFRWNHEKITKSHRKVLVYQWYRHIFHSWATPSEYLVKISLYVPSPQSPIIPNSSLLAKFVYCFICFVYLNIFLARSKHYVASKNTMRLQWKISVSLTRPAINHLEKEKKTSRLFCTFL